MKGSMTECNEIGATLCDEARHEDLLQPGARGAMTGSIGKLKRREKRVRFKCETYGLEAKWCGLERERGDLDGKIDTKNAQRIILHCAFSVLNFLLSPSRTLSWSYRCRAGSFVPW